MRNGYLSLLTDPSGETPITPNMVDWSRTSVWSEGGYYARIFINVQGREPQGTVRPAQYESFRNELAEKLAAITDENGAPMRNQVLRPESIYRSVENVAPDLILYFDGLSRRSIGSVGHGTIHLNGNDTGQDDANHDPEGIFISSRLCDLRRGIRGRGRTEGLSCLDITPTVLHEFGLTVPSHMGGRIINRDGKLHENASNAATGLSSHEKAHPYQDIPAKGYTSEEEEIIKKRLTELGYI
jgi:predicted AlkP superfamily phosphohydrolase/phosphomutase